MSSGTTSITPRLLRLTTVVCLSVVLISCGASVPRQQATGTTVDAVTTTDADSPDTTKPAEPDEPDVPSALTVRDLEAILPVASDIGGDYRVDDSDDDGEDGSVVDDAMEKACPALAELADDHDRESADRSFSTEDGRTVDLSLTPSIADTPGGTAEKFADIVDKLNDCDKIEYDDSGLHVVMTLSMIPDRSFGDFGGVLTMDAQLTAPDLPKPIAATAVMRLFAVGDVGVQMSAASGFDQDTFESIEPDVDLLDELSSDLESQILDLQG